MSGFRVGVVGLGEAGYALHLPALSRLAGAAVVGAADPDASRREAAERSFGVRAYATLDALLRDSRPDVVIVATPPHTHAALAIEALGAGAHVVCEKPFVMTDDEAGAVLATAERAGRQVAVNHEFREMPVFRAAIDAARGDAGGPRFAQVWQAIDLPPWSEAGWRGALDRRTLFEAGVHLVDLLVALFGEIPETVQAHCADGGLDARARDVFVTATFGFSGGRLATLVQNRASKSVPQYLELRVDTAVSCIRASFGGRARISTGLYRSRRPHLRVEFGSSGLAWRETGRKRRVLARNPSEPNVAATRTVLAQTFAALRDGAPLPTSGALARSIMRVIDAAYESSATGHRLNLSVTCPRNAFALP